MAALTPPAPSKALYAALRVCWQLGIPEDAALEFLYDVAWDAQRMLPPDQPGRRKALIWLAQIQAQIRTRQARSARPGGRRTSRS